MSYSQTCICFLGDSYVNGKGDETALGWVGRVCQSLLKQELDLTYYNLGVRGRTSQDVLQNWSELEPRWLDQADNRVVVSFGVNDTVILDGEQRISATEIQDNINLIMNQLKQTTSLVVGPPPVSDFMQNQRIKAYSNQLQQSCQAFDIPFIELFTPLFHDQDYLAEVSQNDGSHPGQTGYRKIAHLVLNDPAWWYSDH